MRSEVLGSSVQANWLLAGSCMLLVSRFQIGFPSDPEVPQVQMEDIAIGNKQQNLCSDCQAPTVLTGLK